MSMIFIEVYDGFGTRLYWDEGSVANVYEFNKTICINGNKSFFKSLAKQMAYFASNDFCLPSGAHIHYDHSFNRSYAGLELILEVIPSTHHGITWDVEDMIPVYLNLPESIHGLHESWHNKAKVAVSENNSVHILADYHGLLFMATVLLFLVENDTGEKTYLCDKELLHGWLGSAVIFNLMV